MRIGIVGAGMIGSTVAKLWTDAGHDVRLASRHPDELDGARGENRPHASAGTPAMRHVRRRRDADGSLEAVPSRWGRSGAGLAGKIVLDTGNAYEQRDGDRRAKRRAHPQGSAGWAAEIFRAPAG